jgi:hypothetical protein
MSGGILYVLCLESEQIPENLPVGQTLRGEQLEPGGARSAIRANRAVNI